MSNNQESVDSVFPDKTKFTWDDYVQVIKGAPAKYYKNGYEGFIASKIGRKQQLEIAPDGKLINNQLINNANSIPDFNKPLTAKDWWKAFIGTYTNGTNNK